MHGGFLSLDVSDHLAGELESLGGWAAVDGKTIAIGGIFELRPECGHAWMWLAREWRRHARMITHAVLSALEAAEYARIEAAVRCDFDAGHRWIERLGFECEAARMKRWGPDGMDYALYARCRNG